MSHWKTVVLVALVATGCTRQPSRLSTSQSRTVHRLVASRPVMAEAFAKGARYATDSMYACLLDAYHQHLSLQQALRVCQLNMLEDADKGWGNDPWAASGMPKPNENTYDPAKVTLACSSGDPRKAQGGGGSKSGNEPLQEGCIGKCVWQAPNQFSGDKFTFGGKGQEGGFGTNEKGEVGVIVYKGLPEEEAAKQKQQALDEEAKAIREYQDLVKEQTKQLEAQGKKSDDWEKDPAMKAAREAAQKKVDAASKKADADPNAEVKGGISRPTPEGGSECEQALQEAREFLRECNRNGWKSNECQTLFAKMNRCPEPSYIYVDPDSGYACGIKADMGTLLEAWRQQCESLRRPNPDGPNPCDPPRVEENGRVLRNRPDSPGDICHSLVAHIDPDSEECAGVVKVQRFGEPKITDLLVFGLNKLGGPTFVIPVGPKTGGDDSPTPGGPKPRPDPKPQ